MAFRTLVPLLPMSLLCACSAGDAPPAAAASTATTGSAATGDATTGSTTGATTGAATGATTGDATGTTTTGTSTATGVATGDATGTATTGTTTTGSGTTTGSSTGAAMVTGTDIMFDDIPEQMVEGCNELEVGFEKRRPTVVFLVDTSKSMFEYPAGVPTRALLWDPLQQAVLTIVQGLQSEVDFGFTSYTAVSQGPAPQGADDPTACPVMATVAVGPNNYDSIAALYESLGTLPTRPDGGPETYKWETPTGESVDLLAQELAAVPSEAPKYIVLVTDGNPDMCEVPDPQCGTDRSVQALQNAYALGITTYVVGIGSVLDNDDGACQGRCGELHLQDLANAGAGQPVAPNDEALLNTTCLELTRTDEGKFFQATYAASEAEAGTAQYFAATDTAQLSEALGSIIQGVRSCDFAMDKEIDPARADLGTVQFVSAGVASDLTYADANGWSFVAPNVVRFEGTACQTLQSTESGSVDISFPCEAFIR